MSIFDELFFLQRCGFCGIIRPDEKKGVNRMQEAIKNDIIRWISLGWEYRIIHKLLERKYNYFLSRDEYAEINYSLARLNAIAIT